MPQWEKTGNVLEAEAKARKAADAEIEKKLPGVATSSTPGLVKASSSIKVAGDGAAEVDVDKLGAALAGDGLDYSSDGGLSTAITNVYLSTKDEITCNYKNSSIQISVVTWLHKGDYNGYTTYDYLPIKVCGYYSTDSVVTKSMPIYIEFPLNSDITHSSIRRGSLMLGGIETFVLGAGYSFDVHATVDNPKISLVFVLNNADSVNGPAFYFDIV